VQSVADQHPPATHISSIRGSSSDSSSGGGDNGGNGGAGGGARGNSGAYQARATEAATNADAVAAAVVARDCLEQRVAVLSPQMQQAMYVLSWLKMRVGMVAPTGIKPEHVCEPTP
jgi:hypothetical protein